MLKKIIILFISILLTTALNAKENTMILKLKDGDILSTNESNFYIVIIAKKEDLIQISSNSKIELTKTAYHLGNRHVEIEIEEDILLTKSDYVIENMLHNFKVYLKNTKKKFFPERGAHNHE